MSGLRVLWLTHTSAAARTLSGQRGEPGPGAWITSLAHELALSAEIELIVAGPLPAGPGAGAGTSGEAADIAETGAEAGDTAAESGGGVSGAEQAAARPRAASGDVPAPGAMRFEPLQVAAPMSRPARLVRRWRTAAGAAELLDSARELVRRLQPDVVHVHGTEGPLGLLAREESERGPAYLVSIQGVVAAWRRNYFRGLTAGEILSLFPNEGVAKGWGPLHEYRGTRDRERTEAAILRGARRFIGRTEWDRAVVWAAQPAAQYFHADEVLRPEFTAAATVPSRAATGGFGEGPPWRVMSTSGRFLGKGTETLVEAGGILRRAGLDVRLRVAGVPADSELGAIYRRRAQRAGAEVEWLGRLDGSALVGELLAAHAFAYPTHVDNSPNALCEAALLGLPAVASCIGGIPSLMTHEVDGLLVQDADPPAVAAALQRLLADRPFAVRLGAAAQARALVRHDPVRIVERMLRIYEAAAERQPPGRLAEPPLEARPTRGVA